MAHYVRLKSVLLVFCIFVLTGTAFSFTRKGGERTLEQLTNESDSVVIGVCKGKKAQFIGRMIETEYEVEVTERLKGKARKGSETISLTLPGGELTTPPITQSVSYTPVMYQGEEVALFLKDNAPAQPASLKAKQNPKSKLWSSPQVVGWAEGKFSVVTDKKTGKKRVARVIPEEYGWANEDQSIRRALKAIASGDAPMTEGEVVPLGEGMYTTPEGKAVLDKVTAGVTYAEEQKKAAADAKAAAAPKTPEHKTEKQRPYGPVVVQDLDDFKAKVRSFVK